MSEWVRWPTEDGWYRIRERLAPVLLGGQLPLPGIGSPREDVVYIKLVKSCIALCVGVDPEHTSLYVGSPRTWDYQRCER